MVACASGKQVEENRKSKVVDVSISDKRICSCFVRRSFAASGKMVDDANCTRRCTSPRNANDECYFPVHCLLISSHKSWLSMQPTLCVAAKTNRYQSKWLVTARQNKSSIFQRRKFFFSGKMMAKLCVDQVASLEREKNRFLPKECARLCGLGCLRYDWVLPAITWKNGNVAADVRTMYQTHKFCSLQVLGSRSLQVLGSDAVLKTKGRRNVAAERRQRIYGKRNSLKMNRIRTNKCTSAFHVKCNRSLPSHCRVISEKKLRKNECASSTRKNLLKLMKEQT